MPRFYLNVHDSSGFAEDEEGQELSGPEQAEAVALCGARSLMSAGVADGDLDLDGRIDVEDSQRKHIFTVRFRDAITINGDPHNCGNDR